MLLIPLIGLSQNNNTNVNIESGGNAYSRTISHTQQQRQKQGTYYQGNGEYLIVEIGNSFRTNVDKMENDALSKAWELKNSKGAYSYKKIISDKTKSSIGAFAEVKVTIQLTDENGNPWLDEEERKENARKKLLELKQFKDEGIITQEEYDKASAPYKKILLGL